MQETFKPAPNAEGLADSDIQLEGDTSAATDRRATCWI